jgi:hypothetical protein
MSVDLTDLHINGDELLPLTLGGLMEGFSNDDYLGRLGDRWAAQISTPPMRIEPDGRLWSARLNRARKEGAIIKIYQPGFVVGAPGSPVVASSTASGRIIPLQGLTPGYAIREGQWFNYIVDGQLYLDQTEEQAIADASGEAEITLSNLIRSPLTFGDAVSFVPKIEGWIKGEFSIPRSVDGVTSFSFLVSEKA